MKLWHTIAARWRTFADRPRPHPARLVGLAAACLFGWYTIFGDQGLITLRGLRRQLERAQRSEGQLRERIQRMEAEAAALKEPEYLEQVIRTELGYVRPGEQIYQFAQPATPEPTISATPEAPAALAMPLQTAPPAPTAESKKSRKTKKNKQ